MGHLRTSVSRSGGSSSNGHNIRKMARGSYGRVLRRPFWRRIDERSEKTGNLALPDIFTSASPGIFTSLRRRKLTLYFAQQSYGAADEGRSAARRRRMPWDASLHGKCASKNTLH